MTTTDSSSSSSNGCQDIYGITSQVFLFRPFTSRTFQILPPQKSSSTDGRMVLSDIFCLILLGVHIHFKNVGFGRRFIFETTELRVVESSRVSTRCHSSYLRMSKQCIVCRVLAFLGNLYDDQTEVVKRSKTERNVPRFPNRS